jgi:hypothetical protein
MAENFKMFEIETYMVIWRQLELREISGEEVQIRAMVRCSGEGYTLDVIFVAPDSPMPNPTFDEEKKKGQMFMPIADIAAFVDVLRNEKPIYGHLRNDRPDFTSVTTRQEPVGEGFMDADAQS